MTPLQDLPTNFIDIALADSFRTGAAANTDQNNKTDAAQSAQPTAGQSSNKPQTGTSPSADFPLPDDLGDGAYERKLAQCRTVYRPSNVIHEMLVATIAAQAIRLDELRRSIAALGALEAFRARYCWADDRRADVAELADRLRRRPDSVRRQLERSLHGCDLLIARWEALKGILEKTGSWDEPERGLVLDLLGIAPELRRGRTPLDPAPGEDAATVGIALAQRELDRLRKRQDPLVTADEFERVCAERGQPAHVSRDMKQWRRLEAQSERLRSQAMKELDRLQLEPMYPQPTPAPQPDASRQTTAQAAPQATEARPFAWLTIQGIKDTIRLTRDDPNCPITDEHRAAMEKELELRRKERAERLAAQAEDAEDDEDYQDDEIVEEVTAPVAVSAAARSASPTRAERRNKDRRRRQRSARKRNRRK